MSRLKLKYAICLAFWAALLAGCAPMPETAAPVSRAPDARAQTMLGQGRFREAAQEYLRLASQASAAQAVEYRLAAVAALIDGADPQGAATLLGSIETKGLTPAHQHAKELLGARLALARHEPQQALAMLPAKVPIGLPPDLGAEMHRTRANAFAQLGKTLEASRERVAMELFLTDPAAIDANRRALWGSLGRLSVGALKQARRPPPDTLGGWIELALVARDWSEDPGVLDQQIARWRASFPGHPAEASIVPELSTLARVGVEHPRHIALLLPLTGRFAKAADAIRDGFLAARFQDPEGLRPAVTLYDTHNADIWSVLDAAVSAGADFVVGPLDKKAVGLLAGSPGLPVPTLALNFADPAPAGQDTQASTVGKSRTDSATAGAPANQAAAGATMPAQPQTAAGTSANAGTPTSTAGTGAAVSAQAPLYQFSLSPEQEAEQVAERAWLDGRLRAAMLTPQGAWGERVARAFASAWERQGGRIVAKERYPQAIKDMGASVRRMLNIDDSERRSQDLKRRLAREIEHEPRRRQDVDFVFMAASPREARQLRPQLRYFRASEVPVYAHPHVYGGAPNPDADRDIDGVAFGDMPWVLAPQGRTQSLQRQIKTLWPSAFKRFARLYAFGVDAYRVVPHLPRLRAQRFRGFPGATGELSVGEDDRIQRQLMWAQFRDGVPRPLATSGQRAPERAIRAQ